MTPQVINRQTRDLPWEILLVTVKHEPTVRIMDSACFLLLGFLLCVLACCPRLVPGPLCVFCRLGEALRFLFSRQFTCTPVSPLLMNSTTHCCLCIYIERLFHQDSARLLFTFVVSTLQILFPCLVRFCLSPRTSSCQTLQPASLTVTHIWTQLRVCLELDLGGEYRSDTLVG